MISSRYVIEPNDSSRSQAIDDLTGMSIVPLDFVLECQSLETLCGCNLYYLLGWYWWLKLPGAAVQSTDS